MKLFSKKQVKLAAGLGLLFSLCTISSSEKVFAEQACSVNPSSLTDDCYLTPVTYKVTIYEMGLCTSDPLSGILTVAPFTADPTIDDSSCTPTFQSSSGANVDLAGGSTKNLVGKNIRPKTGTYPYGYIKMSNTWGLKGSYKINNQTYYSKSDGTPGNEGDYSEFDYTLIDFNNGNTCSTNPDYTGFETFTTGITGTIKASIATVSGGNLGTYTATSPSACGTSQHLFASFAPTSPVVIKDSTQGLQANFTITDSGLYVEDSAGGLIDTFGAGPFRLTFSTF